MTYQRNVLIGFSLALIVGVTVGASLVVLGVPALRTRSHWAVAAVALIGCATLIIGRSEAGDRHPSRRTLRASSAIEEEHPLIFFKHTGYWGWILILSVIPMFLLTRHLCKPLVVAARPISATRIEAELAVPPAAPPPLVVPTFPALTLKGLICHGPRSTAIINGLTVRLGEKIEGVRVVAIERSGITVEMDGRKRNIILLA